MNPPLIGNSTEEIAKDLRSLKLPGMAEAVERMEAQPEEFAAWKWNDRVAWLIRQQEERRFNNRIAACLKGARFRYPMAALEDIIAPEERGLEMDYFEFLNQDLWLERHDNIILLGASGCGKTYLACAVGVAACKLGQTVRYMRTDDLLRELAEAKLTHTYEKTLQRYAKPKVLILDEFLLSQLVAAQTADLLNLIERRYLDSSLVICTQYPIEEWIDRLCVSSGNQPLCEAILDRIVHAAKIVPIGGDISMRERIRRESNE